MISLPIFANGTYSGDLKEGTYTVTVDTESLNPAKKQKYRGQGGGGVGYQMYGKAGAASDAPAAGPQ
jgi:hypothetical protein